MNNKDTVFKNVGNLKVAKELFDFINNEVIPGTEIDKNRFWDSFDKSAHSLSEVNKELLKKREKIQSSLDKWHREHRDKKFDKIKYKEFLKSINYIVNENENFQISTKNVDEEISLIAGPQLVVPVDNARYALNAANARWGSLYDALYGTDAIEKNNSTSSNLDAKRAQKVRNYTREFLDKALKINDLSWKEIKEFKIEKERIIFLKDDKTFYLSDEKKFIGISGDRSKPSPLLFKNNGLHIEIKIDKESQIGKADSIGIQDVILESAVSTIVDNEDSVAAVDAEDKVRCYRNWLLIMKGTLETKVKKNGKEFLRKLNKDKIFYDLNGKKIILHGRSLLLNRNVGHLMTTPAIILKDGKFMPEGILDAFISVMCAIHDFKNKLNSRTGSVYIVKPKMHGPDEVKFTNEIFNNVEKILGLPAFTIKVGIMDEERRTTINLKECIRQVKERIVFINTGFLDRTGDEIHTSFESGPMIFKGDMKKSKWLNTYEDWNVDIGLSCGFTGKAQIGKGMWAMPDKMKDMLSQKISHPKSGANCAWVPSPTAATLHSTHYHLVNVFEIQKNLKSRKRADLNNILEIPKHDRPNWSKEDIDKELNNNIQSILGYVVRWIDQGIGCSKVPDINNVGLMEDRATLRISSQHISNWIHHNICSKEEVLEKIKKMAVIVDKQNEKDANYKKMSENFDQSIAFKAACDLIFEGRVQPAGYTEPLLHKRRIEKKITL